MGKPQYSGLEEHWTQNDVLFSWQILLQNHVKFSL